MDSNFSVKITADISELQSRMAAVEAITGKFKKSMDDASGSVKNMEQNANRGRMVAFAFGQVIRDAGFFANSFSLGILAISNNIPILIDQLSLSIKALQPFAGALSMIGSILTAGLTIWAYSTQAVKENKNSLEEWRKSLDDTVESRLRGTQSAQEELITLKLLYAQTQNTALSTKKRLEAVNELQDKYPSYFGNLSDEAILTGNVGSAYDKLSQSILASSRARAGVDIMVENQKIILDNEQKILEQRQQRAVIDKQLAGLEAQIKNAPLDSYGGPAYAAGSTLNSLVEQRTKLQNQRNETVAEANRLDGENYKLNQSNLLLYKQVNAEIANGGSLTNNYGKPAEQAKDIFAELSKSIQAIELDPTISEIERATQIISAHRTALRDLIDDGFKPTSSEVVSVTNALEFYNSYLEKLKNNKAVIDAIDRLKLSIEDLNDNGFSKNELIEKRNELIGDFTRSLKALGLTSEEVAKILSTLGLSLTPLEQDFANVKLMIDNLVQNIWLSMEEVGYALATGGNVGSAFGSSILNAIGDFLVKFGLMIVATSKAGQALAKAMQNIFDPSAWGKSLVAGLALIALGGAAKGFASSMSRGSSGRGGGGNNMTKAPSAPTSMPSFSMPTTFQSSMAMNSGIIAQTSISGNDLSILVKRADKNRNAYYG